jgi:hypothetical protein
MKDQRAAGMMVFLMLAVAACASHAPAETAGPSPVSRAESARDSTGLQVQIDTQNINDMSIYLVRTGTRFLVGQAGGLSKTTLTIPEAMTPSDLRVRLIAEPIGGSRPIATPVLLVAPGQSVYWSIGFDPATSTASAG